jgi:hypothetical protein
MDAPNELKHRAALSDYLAAERTFFAWVRTGAGRTGHGHLSDFRSWFREYFIRKEF